MIEKNIYLKNNMSGDNLDKEFLEKYSKIVREIKQEIKQPNKLFNIFNKKFKFNFEVKDIQKFKRFKKIAIIGMGGSILGAEAIYGFFEQKIKKKFFFINDLNEQIILNLKKEKISKILFIIISKSGNTIETLSNVAALNILKKSSKSIIIISEKRNNTLYAISQNYNLYYIEHKDYVGGRFSVFSEVGIIPAYLMGINIDKLRSQLLIFLRGKHQNFLKESTIKLAKIIKEQKIKNLIFLNYSPKLEKFLYWCQQLIAESLGKKNQGFLPFISNVPKDHHSLLQLYLDGPKDKIFHIFYHENKVSLKLKSENLSLNANYLKNKTLNDVKNAQKNALIKALKENKSQFREFKILGDSEDTLGALFSYFILETIIVGKLININPFNQPAVEKVKIFTKKFLK